MDNITKTNIIAIIIIVGLAILLYNMANITELEFLTSISNESIQALGSVYNTNQIAATNIKSTADTTVGGNLNVAKVATVDGLFNANGDLNVQTITGRKLGKDVGRIHITGDELLYLLNKNGVIVGKEWGGNGNLTVQGKFCIGNTCIDETHLQILTGARSVAMKHTSGAWTNKMDLPYVHVGQDANVVKWTNAAYFALEKQ